MSKYGSGVRMKQVIVTETEMVESILRKSNLSQEDIQTVMDAFREMAYQWCTSNASACAFSAFLKDSHPNVYEDSIGAFLGSDVYHKEYQRVLAETFPDPEE